MEPIALRSVVAVLVLGACASPSPTLEQQAGRQDLRKQPCADSPVVDYEAHPDARGLTVDAIDCGFAYPTSIAISADGRVAFVAQLKGLIYVYEKIDGRFALQAAPFHDLGELGVSDEAGLTGITLAPEFDLDAEAAERRDVFFAFQLRTEDGTTRNRVQRVTAARRDGAIVARDARNIFTSEVPSAQAHQIHGGVAFTLRGATHVLFPVGHSHYAEHGGHEQEGLTTAGTLIVMQRDGSPPLGAHPWPEQPLVHAIGVRNVYGLELLPESIDPSRGLIGFENGDHESDRAWLVHPVDFAGDHAYRVDLGYAGDDGADGWTRVPDPAVDGDDGKPRNAVFHLWQPIVSPTAVSLHPGAGMIPASDADGVSLVAAFFGQSGTNDLGPGKDVQLVRLHHVQSGELTSEARVLVRRKTSSFGEFRHPVALDVDPIDGSIYFADIISGVLYRIGVEEEAP